MHFAFIYLLLLTLSLFLTDLLIVYLSSCAPLINGNLRFITDAIHKYLFFLAVSLSLSLLGRLFN